MKRLITLIMVSFLALSITLSSFAINPVKPQYDDNCNNLPLHDIIESVLQNEVEWEEVSAGDETVFLTTPYYTSTYKIVSSMESNGTITTLIHDTATNMRYMYVYMSSDETLTCKAIIYYEVIDLNKFYNDYKIAAQNKNNLSRNSTNENYSLYTIRENEESWWSMGTYFNTSSAKKDRYWRMFNPRNDTDHIYFFSYIDSPEHQYATEYMDFIGQMDSKEQAVETYYGMSVPLAILSFTSPTLSAIVNALTLENLDSGQAQNILDIYALRDKADTRYNFVLDICE